MRLQIRRPTSFLQLLETIGVLIIFLLGLLSFYSKTKCALETTFSLFEESNLKIFKEDLSTIAITNKYPEIDEIRITRSTQHV